MNFGFLASKPEYALFSDACIEAERTFTTTPPGRRRLPAKRLRWQ